MVVTVQRMQNEFPTFINAACKYTNLFSDIAHRKLSKIYVKHFKIL